MKAILSGLPEPPHQESGSSLRTGLLLAVAALTGCASPWVLAEGTSAIDGAPPSLPPHLAVAEARITLRGREFPAMAWLRMGDGRIRGHLAADSGLTILDLTVQGAAIEVHRESPLAGPPGLGLLLGEDLRRVYGDRSLYALGGSWPPARAVLGDPVGRFALPLPDGSFLAVLRDPFRVTLLGADRVPEAEVDYLDPGPDGLPREVRLRDLVDGHAVLLDVVEVRNP
jgi:hypothetical protein